MDGIDVGFPRHVDDLVDAQIAFAAGSRADGISFIGVADMQRCAIRFGEDSNRRDPPFLAGAQDPHGNFTSIGD